MGFISDFFDETAKKYYGYYGKTTDKYGKPGKSGIERMAMMYIGDHYDEMPRVVKNYVMQEAKRKIAQEYPIVALLCPEGTKEKLIKKYFTPRPCDCKAFSVFFDCKI